ncbi:MAG: hypothetical protein Kow00105_08780 [Phycisphaeraceae bacterium]
MPEVLHNAEQVGCSNLLELAPVVPGATVSKPVLDGKGLRQIVFAMDAGQTMSEHRAPFLAVVQVLYGELDFGVAGRKHRLQAHDWLTMPPDTPHDLTAIKPTRFLLSLVKEPKP